MSGYVVILLFLILVLLKCPIPWSFLIPSAIYFVAEGFPDLGLMQFLSSQTQSFTIVAIPMFIYVGCLMNKSGVSDYLLKFCNILVGRFRGALAYCNILTSLLFAGVSGSALADIGGVGKVVLYAMKQDGYSDEDAIGITGASSTIGPIFPPSIPLMIYAMAAEVSATKLLISGVVPAIGIVIALCIYVFIIARKKTFATHHVEYSGKEKVVALLKSLPAVCLPGILILGLLSGKVGATALAAFSCVLIILIGSLVYREMSFKKFIEASKESLRTTGNIMFIMCSACVFARVLTLSHVAKDIATLLLGVSTSPTVLLLMAVVFLLIIGMFVDASAAILISTPLLLPALTSAGVDPIHFGLVMVLTLMIGLLTPPVGMSLYMLSDVSGVPLNKTMKAIIPYYNPLLIVLILIVFIPGLATWLPNFLS
jgi:tripartite ATP-independent transporter DctM subunit